MNLRNKTVWITGASSGIGEHLAYSCIKRGATVILSARNKEKLEKVQIHCTSLGGNCYIYPFDLADSGQIEKVADDVLQQFKNIDLLINNGGISQRSLAIETLFEVDRKIMEINYFGTVALTRKVVPVMIKNGGGNIAVTSSLMGIFGFKLRSSYSASKHALHGYFESLRAELFDKNIHITIVCPGGVKTNLSFSALSKDGAMHGKMDDVLKRGISAEKCSEKYIKGIEKNKKEVLIGKRELIMVYLKRFAPFLFHRIIAKVKAT